MNAQVCIESILFENNVLYADGSLPREFTGADSHVRVVLNGKNIPFRYTERYAELTIREETLTDRIAFVLELPAKMLQSENRIEFFRTEAGKECRIPLITGGYQARVSTLLHNAYWCFGKEYMLTLARGSKTVNGIMIRRVSQTAKIGQELKLLKEIATAGYGSKQMAVVRGIYWLTRPVYRKKNIWITFDKLYKGGDNGEYFYKYMSGRKDTDVRPVYVLKKEAADFGRLEREGYHPSQYRSLNQRLLYLNAKMVFGTHSGVNSFCGFNNWEVQFVQDRLTAVNTCIQHGLSVQDLRADSHRVLNNNRLYFCASHCETENLSKPAYDYDPQVLRLTGVPRYDGLISDDRKQILITPTWRSYIAMPAAMGNTRPYNPDFKDTDYYKIYQSLIENKQLAKTAEETGYRLIYLLHPVLSAQKKDFQPAAGVEILSAVDSNYEQLLTQSSLMVTDYSGVQFDFAYMRKPVLYFHPEKLPPHYEEGGFFYDTQGFGPVCRTSQALADTLCAYMKNGCRMESFYQKRADEFFEFDDHENCRRIFETASAYQKMQVPTGRKG